MLTDSNSSVSWLVAKHAARLLWAMAWSSWVEEKHGEGKLQQVRFEGVDVIALAPPTPPAVVLHAWTLIGHLEAVNEVSLYVLLHRARAVVPKHLRMSEATVAEKFGDSLALAAEGSGAGWEDSLPRFDIVWPYHSADIDVESFVDEGRPYELMEGKQFANPFAPGGPTVEICSWDLRSTQEPNNTCRAGEHQCKDSGESFWL